MIVPYTTKYIKYAFIKLESLFNSEKNCDKPVDIEVACCLEPHRIPFTVDTGLSDLFFISQCQGYISTISISEFSRCGWFLQMAEQEHITPYINMNDEILDMNMRDKLLLL